VQAAFEIAEEHADGLDALLIGEISQALFLDFVRRNAIFPLRFGPKIQFFQLCIRQAQKVLQG
jgi:hypothetical protein